MSPPFLCCFDQIFFKPVGNKDRHEILNMDFGEVGPFSTELGALERLNNFP